MASMAWLWEGNSLGFCPVSLDSALRWCGLWALLWQLAQYKLLSAHRKCPPLSGNGVAKCFIPDQEELLRCEAEGSPGQGAGGADSAGRWQCQVQRGRRCSGSCPKEEQPLKSCRRPAWELTQSPSSTRRARGCRQ